MGRGSLRIYLGAAPGVGKTFAMLNEGRRRRRAGHRRRRRLRRDPRPATHRRADRRPRGRPAPDARATAAPTFEEMDLDAVLARRPEVALVDELAHTNVPGCRNAKRWQDVEELLDAGIDVISTVNIQHLESLNDVVERITGVKPARDRPRRGRPGRRPDRAGRHDPRGAAPPHGPRQHLRAREGRRRPGQLLPGRQPRRAARAGAAVGGRPGRRRARGLPRRATASPSRGRPGSGSSSPSPARPAASTSSGGRPASPSGPTASCSASTSQPDDGLAGGPSRPARASTAGCSRSWAATYHEVAGGDVAAALVDFARAENATQLVLGRQPAVALAASSPRARSSTGSIRLSGADRRPRHLAPTPTTASAAAARRSPPARSRRCRRRRQLLGLGAGRSSGCPLLTARCSPTCATTSACPSVLLLYLLLVVARRRWSAASFPALVAAVGGFLLANWYFTPPLYTLHASPRPRTCWPSSSSSPSPAIVSVPRRPRRPPPADAAPGPRRGRGHGRAWPARWPRRTRCPRWSTTCARTFGMRAASRSCVATATTAGGSRRPRRRRCRRPAPTTPTSSRTLEPATLVLALSGGALAAEDQRVLNAFAAQLAAARRGAAACRPRRPGPAPLAEANDLRTALLQAVSHDLRTPLASIKASVTSLRQHDVDWSPTQTGRVPARSRRRPTGSTALVGNLLDMSRLQAGALQRRRSGRSASRRSSPARARQPRRRGRGVVDVDVPETLPRVVADPALLERVVANLVDNAVACSPPDARSRIEAGAVAGRVDLRVVDRGPGIPAGGPRAGVPALPAARRPTTAPASASAWPSPGASSRRWAASSSIEDTPGRRHHDGRRAWPDGADAP